MSNTKNGDSFASATESGAVTPSSTTPLTFNALYIGTTGDVEIEHIAGRAITVYVGVPGGSILPVSGKRVLPTNTTATNIVWMNW